MQNLNVDKYYWFEITDFHRSKIYSMKINKHQIKILQMYISHRIVPDSFHFTQWMTQITKENVPFMQVTINITNNFDFMYAEHKIV